MNSRMPTVKAGEVVRVLRKLGFLKLRQKGAHICFKHNDGRFTLVPNHAGEDIGRGLLRQILKEAEISPKEFLERL